MCEYGGEEWGACGDEEWGACGDEEWGACGDEEWGACGDEEWGACEGEEWGACEGEEWHVHSAGIKLNIEPTQGLAIKSTIGLPWYRLRILSR